MKRHLKHSLLIFALAGCLTSCLKDENATVLYSSQEIPDINYFMPSSLLNLMGNENLHFGDEPPRISGTFYADSLVVQRVKYADTTMNIHSVIEGNQLSNSYLNIFEQHKGIIKCEYTAIRKVSSFDIYEFSRVDSTHSHFRSSSHPLTDSPTKPIYFEDSKIDLDDFHRAYIMGEGNDFTMYYYDVLCNYAPPTVPFNVNSFYPVIANIISGTLDERSSIQYDSLNNPTDTIKEQIIKNFIWGKEVLGYFKDGTSLQQIIEQGMQPKIGDAWYIKNSGVNVYQKPYEGDF